MKIQKVVHITHQFSSMYLSLLCIGLLQCLNSVYSSCQPCKCFPSMDTATLMLCQGGHIFNFPLYLDKHEKEHLKEIYITETYINCMPIFTEYEYKNMHTFGESNNPLLNCSCLFSWWEYFPPSNFSSDCDYESVTEMTVPSPSKSLTTTMTSTQVYNYTRGTILTDAIQSSSTSPPLPEEEGKQWSRASIIISSVMTSLTVIGLTLLIIRFIKCIYHIWRRRRVRVNNNIPLHVINPIYNGADDMFWDNYTPGVGGSERN